MVVACHLRTSTPKYPINTPSVRPPKERASGLIDLGWDFEVLAVFRNTGKDATGRDCDCACCRFKQMVEGVNQQHIPGAEEQKAEVKGEDCRDVMVGGQRKRICYGRGDAELRYSERNKDHSHEVMSETGEVGSLPPGLQEKVDAAIAEAAKGDPTITRDTVCVYFMRDKPGLWVNYGTSFKKDICYRGQIWTVCPAEKLKVEQKFRLYMAGVMHANLDTDPMSPAPKWAEKPDGKPRTIPKCDPP